MNIGKVDNLNFDKLYKILNSSAISETEKTKFVVQNGTQIKQMMKHLISGEDFKTLMDNRVLKKFRPLKNSYTKWGDKVILSKSLNIPLSEVPKYVKNVVSMMNDAKQMKPLSPRTLEMIKTYIYRHGSRTELVSFFDYELGNSKNIQKTLKNTLEYYNSGIADYFIRPIHRMDNKTLLKLFDVVNKNLKIAEQNGQIVEEDARILAKYALVKLYYIQSNSKLINSIKNYKTLK